MSTVKTDAYKAHPACQRYDQELDYQLNRWERRHEHAGRPLKPIEETELRMDIDRQVIAARIQVEDELKAEGLRLADEWVGERFTVDVVPLDGKPLVEVLGDA